MLLDLAWTLTRPLLFSLDAEQAHRTVLGSLSAAPRLSAGSLRAMGGSPPASLACNLGPLRLPSPVGLAAGLDKDGEAIEVWPSLGFGFVEVGTVTAHAQVGNDRPRLFRLVPERGLINRMGFNNHGSQALADRLRALHDADRWPSVPVGANIGKSKITPLDEAPADYRTSAQRLAGLVDYFTVNVSSPNTPGLRALQQTEPLRRILGAVLEEAGTAPVFVKFSPDMDWPEQAQAIDAAIDAGVAGIIATNTTNARPDTTGRSGETGGLSGAPLWPQASTRIKEILAHVAERVPVVGVGGVDDGSKAEALLTAGCAAVQVYSAMIFQGPGLIRHINQHLHRVGGA